MCINEYSLLEHINAIVSHENASRLWSRKIKKRKGNYMVVLPLWIESRAMLECCCSVWCTKSCGTIITSSCCAQVARFALTIATSGNIEQVSAVTIAECFLLSADLF